MEFMNDKKITQSRVQVPYRSEIRIQNRKKEKEMWTQQSVMSPKSLK